MHIGKNLMVYLIGNLFSDINIKLHSLFISKILILCFR